MTKVYHFDEFELDLTQSELRRAGVAQAIEPQVFDLLALLVENAGLLVTKDALADTIWRGRVVSDSAISSRIKSARSVLGDDGKAQRFIKTVHGRGVRFVGDVAATGATSIMSVAAAPPSPPAVRMARPSIAILPFHLIGAPDPYGTIADALPHELITELSRLRWLFVIARGSAFRFGSSDADVRSVGTALDVSYCLTGTVELLGNRLGVTVELADTRDGGVVWADSYAGEVESIHDVRARILSSVVSALEIQITDHEAQRAQLTAPGSLDAWAAYHLGLKHMYRFTKADNAAAEGLFTRAVSLDPNFCRAHAGLSFTNFQDAFLHHTPDTRAATALSRQHAERSLEIDARDPFANLTMGRSYWLEGALDQSVAWLGRATSLCPNYAKSIYAQAWTETLSGRGGQGQAFADSALALSPLDPLLYAMQATRALSHFVREDYATAAEWADKGARTPGAHVLIDIIALAAHAVAGNEASAKRWHSSIRRRAPGITSDDFFASFPFADDATRTLIASALGRYGI